MVQAHEIAAKILTDERVLGASVLRIGGSGSLLVTGLGICDVLSAFFGKDLTLSPSSGTNQTTIDETRGPTGSAP